MTLSNTKMPGYALPILFFRVAGMTLGTDLRWVREVVNARELTPLPNANSFVAGVVNIRGDVISVLDTASLLNNRITKERWERIVLLDTPGAPVGLAVESVMAVQAVMPETFSAVSRSDLNDIPEEYISGVTKWHSSRVSLLNISALVSHLKENTPYTKEERA